MSNKFMDKYKDIFILGAFAGFVGTIVHFAASKVKLTPKLVLSQVIISVFVGSITTSALLYFFPKFPPHFIASVASLLALWSNHVVLNFKALIDIFFKSIAQFIKNKLGNNN